MEDNIFIKHVGCFLEYFETKNFYDCVILVQPLYREIKAHRIVLSNCSSYFFEYFKSVNNNDNEIITVSLSWINDTKEYIDKVIRWMYCGEIDLTPQNCVTISAYAERLQISLLQTYCDEYINRNLRRENAVNILIEANNFKARNLIHKSISNVASNICHINQYNINCLSPKLLMKVLLHENLVISEEFKLYHILSEYVREHQDHLSEKKITKIMSQIRYRWLTIDQLYLASENPFVPKSLIIEALMYRIYLHEKGKDDIEKRFSTLPIHFQKRPKRSIVFEYNEENPDFFKGLIGWISTNAYKDEWKNAHTSGKVKIHSSSLAKGSRSYLVDQTPNEVWTSDTPSSWISIDLGPRRLMSLTYYSLRHGGNYKGDLLRTWDLQGSTDGITWKIIKKHSNDQLLNAPFDIHSWPIEHEGSYRFFRILQTGHNSSKHHFLVLNGFEFFGYLDDDV